MLVGTELCAVSYGAGFSFEVVRSQERAEGGVPLVVRVTPRSDWRVGAITAWAELLAARPWPDPSTGERDDPMRAYALVWLCGSRIEAVDLSDQGDLSITTSLGATLRLSGCDAVFEESWIVDVPPGVPGHGVWSVVCSDSGNLWSRYPAGLL